MNEEHQENWQSASRNRLAENERRIKQEQRHGGRQGESIARVWRCPHCGQYASKWTSLTLSTRYWPCEGHCKSAECREVAVKGRKTRNILKHQVETRPTREEGLRLARQFNRAAGVDA